MEFSKLKAISSSFERIKADPFIIFGISSVAVIFWAASFYVAFSIREINEILGIFLLLFVSITSLFTLMGLLKAVIKFYDEQRVSLMDFFLYYDNFPSFLISLLLYVFVIFSGMLFVVIPGIFFAVRFSLAPFYCLEEKGSAVKMMKKSWKTTAGYFFDLLILYLILTVLNIIGITVYIGFIFTLPVSLMVVIHSYRRLSTIKEKAEVERISALN